MTGVDNAINRMLLQSHPSKPVCWVADTWPHKQDKNKQRQEIETGFFCRKRVKFGRPRLGRGVLPVKTTLHYRRRRLTPVLRLLAKTHCKNPEPAEKKPASWCRTSLYNLRAQYCHIDHIHTIPLVWYQWYSCIALRTMVLPIHVYVHVLELVRIAILGRRVPLVHVYVQI
jgi:hypothetical protein